VIVQVEENKLQFSCVKTKEFAWATELPRIAATYLEVLPHVAYRGVGLNYQLISKHPQGQAAEDQLIARLLVPGPWSEYAGGLTGANVELQFRKSEPQLALRVGVQEINTPEGKKLEGYQFRANIHHDFSPEERTQRREYMTRLGDKYSEVVEVIKLLQLEPTWQKQY
jgi:hypothetical protein